MSPCKNFDSIATSCKSDVKSKFEELASQQAPINKYDQSST